MKDTYKTDHEKTMEAIAKCQERIKTDPDFGKELLVKAGIMTVLPNGHLTPTEPYRKLFNR